MMDLASTKNSFFEYADLTKTFFTTSVQDVSDLEECANNLLIPLRLCLTKWQGMKISLIGDVQIAEKEYAAKRVLSILKIGTAMLGLAILSYSIMGLAASIFIGILTAAVGSFIPVGSAVGIIIGVINGALGVTATTGIVAGLVATVSGVIAMSGVVICGTLLAISTILLAMTVAGVILKAISWSSNSAVINQYRQYCKQEREICAAAAATRRTPPNQLEVLSIDENRPVDANFSAGGNLSVSNINIMQTSLDKLPYELALSIGQYLDDENASQLRLVSKRCANWGRTLKLSLREAKLRETWGAEVINQVGMDKLMAAPKLKIPYRSFTIDDVKQIQRCGSTDYSEEIKGLKIKDLGACEVYLGDEPRPFIALRKERQKNSSWAKLAHRFGLRSSPCVKEAYIEVLYPATAA